MKYTENYQLNQWEESDRVLMEDFNADNQKIETALGTIPLVAFGSYNGDGTETRTFHVGFYPKVVLLECTYGQGSGSPIRRGLATRSSGVYNENMPDTAVLSLTSTGFQVRQIDNRSNLNMVNYTYNYIAIG